MPIVFRCGHCNQKLSVTRRKAGRTVTCPSCQGEITVPEAGSPSKSRSADVDPLRDYIADERAQGDESPGEASVNEPRQTAAASPAGVSQTAASAEDEVPAFSMRSAETEFEDMDLTPMVDVTFLLLIFFMITASFSLQKTIKIPPPDPNKQGAQQTQQEIQELLDQSIQVEIDERNNIIIDDDPLSDPSMLVDALRDRMLSDQKNEMVLTANAKALHETVVAVVDAANEVGIQKIRLATTGSTN